MSTLTAGSHCWYVSLIFLYCMDNTNLIKKILLILSWSFSYQNVPLWIFHSGLTELTCMTQQWGEFLDIVFLLSCQYVSGMFITSDIEWLITTLSKEVVASLISFLQTRWSFFNFLWLLNENVGDTKRVRVHYITIII